MDEIDKNTMKRIVLRLVLGNMANGSDYETAKNQALNRLVKECPDVVMAYLEAF